MLLTITTTHKPATDLGYLLYKNPGKLQSFDLSFGKVHIFYPEANEEKCTAALLMDIDPVGLVRNRRQSSGTPFAIEHYVNDRPYVASSFLSVAISKVFGSAMTGNSRERPQLARENIPLEVKIATLPCHGGESILRDLFEPLGYQVSTQRLNLDEKFPEWGQSHYYSVGLKANCRLSDLLAHLYVLIPVLDDDKHYWIDKDEADKLLRHGKSWLAAHPQRNLITNRYLQYRGKFTREVLARLTDEDNSDPDLLGKSQAREEELIEKTISLNEQRLATVVETLKNNGVKQVVDFGCGEGKLLRLLLEDKSFEQVTGMDVAYHVLEKAKKRLKLDRLPEKQQEKITLLQGSLTYKDERLKGCEAATIIEVIEHLDLPRLEAFEQVLFGYTAPDLVVLTTPNVEFNVKFSDLPAGKYRHKDHRFEWNRDQFQNWASAIGNNYGYHVRFDPVGPEDDTVGPPTQMAVFRRVK